MSGRAGAHFVMPRHERVPGQRLAITLVAAGLALIVVIGLISHRHHRALPRQDVLMTRAITFQDRPDGGIVVRDAGTGNVVGVVPPTKGGFVRGVMRVMARMRRERGLPPGGAVDLAYLTNRRLILRDPADGEFVDLAGFGPTNAAAFAAFLSPGAGSAS